MVWNPLPPKKGSNLLSSSETSSFFRKMSEFCCVFMLYANLNCLLLVPLFILGVECHEFEDHQVETGSDNGQTKHDEEQGENYIAKSLLKGPILL